MRERAGLPPTVYGLTGVVIWTDGSVLRNPGPGGWAALTRVEGEERMIVGTEADTTNNRMELCAVIEGLSLLPPNSEVEVISDSRYVIDSSRKWLAKWMTNNWKTASGDAVKNRDMWEQLAAVAERHVITWTWCPAHAGIPENEMVDEAARSAARHRAVSSSKEQV